MKTISIGRDDQCDIVIVDKTNVVSRRHAVIMIDSYGRMTITDYSANGTYINGIRMSQNVAVPITRKDTVSFAHTADLDWRLVPDVRGKIIKLSSVIASCVVAVAITLGIVLGKEDPTSQPVNNSDTTGVISDTTTHKDRKIEENQQEQDTTAKIGFKEEDVKVDVNKPEDENKKKHDGENQGKAGGKNGHKADKRVQEDEEGTPVDPII